jgi:hypothetical protein
MSLTAPIDTPERPGRTIVFPIAAATIIYAGSLVAVDAAGNAVPATDAAGLRVKGRAEATVDNTLGLAGDQTISVKRGVFQYANSGTHAVSAADVGGTCYIEDEATVASSSTNKIAAGKVVSIDDSGVWVDTAQRMLNTALVAPVAAAVAATGSALASYGYTQAQADALVAMVNQLRAAILEVQAALND